MTYMTRTAAFKVGDIVWEKQTGSGITMQCEIIGIKLDSRTSELYAEVKGVTLRETKNTWLKNLFITKEDVIAACQDEIKQYKEQLIGDTKEETIKNLLQFACTELITPSEEYTNWAAHEAFVQVASLVGYDLNK